MIALVNRMRLDGLLDAQRAGRVAAGLEAGQDLAVTLRQEAGLSEEAQLDYLARALHLERVDLTAASPSAELVRQFPTRILLKHQLLPLEQRDGAVRVACRWGSWAAGLDELQMASDLPIEPVLAETAQIARWLNGLLGVGADTMEVLVSEANGQARPVETLADLELDGSADEASIITLVNQILHEAIERRATDVHLEPFEKSLRVRYRVDGVLQEAALPREVYQFHPAIVSRLKILGQLDIGEKRVPQDGRIKLRVAGREVDVRVSVIPMLHGEAVVLRLLDRSSPLLGLERLGMSGADRAQIEGVLGLPHGIVLVTGPTGSGKTTTLYACLTQINDIERKIVTIEDPIEYHLHGISQIQVQPKAGLTFARGLRAVLRHDPDVVLIGEIRDQETAEIAVQASLTGHLVFSTLHTNDAPGAAIRLIDMGVEPYLVASSVEVVVAQRLVRTICPACRQEYRPHDVSILRDRFGEVLPERFFRGAGCSDCHGTGFWGRVGIFEIMPVSAATRTLVLERAPGPVIRRQAAAEGMLSLRDDGWRLVRQGSTTVDEVLRVTKDELHEEQR